MDTNTVHACAFCGGESVLIHDDTADDSTQWKYYIICKALKCGVKTPAFPTAVNPLKIWNNNKLDLLTEASRKISRQNLEFSDDINIKLDAINKLTRDNAALIQAIDDLQTEIHRVFQKEIPESLLDAMVVASVDVLKAKGEA